jgi:thioredoxin 1
MIIELNEQNFNETTSKGIVMIDFWAPWCNPCNMLSPIIDEVAKENVEVVVGKVNVDDYPELASKHGVMSIPTLIFFKNGQFVDSSVGVVPKSVILNKLELISG